jgi:hypothetical protein
MNPSYYLPLPSSGVFRLKYFSMIYLAFRRRMQFNSLLP